MSTAFAQNSQSQKVSRVQNKVMHTASIDLQTGVITRGPSIKQKSIGSTATATSVANLDFAGFIGIDSGLGSGNGPCEWFSSVDKSAGANGGQSTYMTSFVFAYCSIARSTLSGGPGATATMQFWDGFFNGLGATAGATGTNILSVTLTGLPGHTGLTSFLTTGFANCQAFVFNVGVGGGGVPVVIPDSASLAVSTRFDDLASDGTLGATATFLSCVASCSGLGPDGFGMVDRIDKYCGGTFRTSFSFNTQLGISYSSVSFSIRELAAVTAAAVSSNATGGNTINTRMLFATVLPTIGGPLTCNTTTGGVATGSTFYLFAFVPRGAESDLGAKLGTLLVNDTPGTGLPIFAVPNTGAAINTFAVPAGGAVPFNTTLYGACFFVQSFVGTAGAPNGPGVTNLSNLATVTVGS